jgi:hypothetical protein
MNACKILVHTVSEWGGAMFASLKKCPVEPPRAAVRARKYHRTFTGSQMKGVKQLEKNMTQIYHEFQSNIELAHIQRRVYNIPNKVFGTRHTAALAIGTWFHAHRAHFARHEIQTMCDVLFKIQAQSAEDPVSMIESADADDILDVIESWVLLTQIYRLCLREARCLRELEIDVSEPTFIVYPPPLLLKIESS